MRRPTVSPVALVVALVFAFVMTPSSPADAQPKTRRANMGYVLDLNLNTLEGGRLDLAQYRGRVLLIVNVASNSASTDQYAGLQSLYEAYRDRGLVVIGVPSNDFLWQEPGTPDEIRSFVSQTYHVSFPLTEKSVVSGPKKIELYRRLTQDTAEDIRGEVTWNFEKFLIDRRGRVVARFDAGTEPLDRAMVRAIERALDMPVPAPR